MISPLIPATFFADAATFPLPVSQESSAPASATLPCCLSAKIARSTRARSSGAFPEVFEVISSSIRFCTFASKSGADSSAPASISDASTFPTHRSTMSPSAPRGHELVPSSCTTLR